MWANETFDPQRPDTFFEPVEEKIKFSCRGHVKNSGQG